MRHSPQELADLIIPYGSYFAEGLTAGIESVAKIKFPGIYAANKRALLSHNIRSKAFDYFEANPQDDLSIMHKLHHLNQAIGFIHEESGLEIRIRKLKGISVAPQLVIPRINEDPAITNTLFDLERQFQNPGLVVVSYESPKLDKNGLPTEEIELTAVRPKLNTKIKDGVADAIIPLTNSLSAIPKSASFDPNVDDYIFEEDKDDKEQDNA